MSVSGLDHVNIVTRDAERTVRFYQALLDLTEVKSPRMSGPNQLRWLGDTGGRPIVHIQTYDAARHDAERLRPGTGPLDHVALHCEGYEETLARIAELGVACRTSEVPGFNLRQIFVTDPDGIVLELNFRG